MKKLCMLLLLFCVGCSQQEMDNSNLDNPVSTLVEREMDDEIHEKDQVLILVGNEFGNTYFEMVDALENQDFEVKTLGVKRRLLSSCPNHDVVEIEADFLVEDMTEDDLLAYKAIFIPAGKHHRSIHFNNDVRRILNACKDENIIISSVCAGNIVLARIDGLIEGYEIASSAVSNEDIKDAGGIVKYNKLVVDGIFITGASGSGSFSNAPIEEIAEAIRQSVDSKLSNED